MSAFKSFYDLMEGYLALPLLLVLSLCGGLILAFIYKYVKKGFTYTKFLPLAIVGIPLAMAALVGLLNLRNSEIETSDTIRVGVVLTAGIALTRFRSDKLAIEDMLYLVFASSLGIVFGLGYGVYGAITLAIMAILLLTLHHFRFGEDMGGVYSLRFKIPEEMNQESVLQEAISKHCESQNLSSVRTVEYGQLYELRYDVKLKKGESIASLMDEVRLHNGNLEVVVSTSEKKQ